MATGSPWLRVYDETGRLMARTNPALRHVFHANGLRLEDEPMLGRGLLRLAEQRFRKRRILRTFALRAWAAVKRAWTALRCEEFEERMGALR